MVRIDGRSVDFALLVEDARTCCSQEVRRAPIDPFAIGLVLRGDVIGLEGHPITMGSIGLHRSHSPQRKHQPIERRDGSFFLDNMLVRYIVRTVNFVRRTRNICDFKLSDALGWPRH
jgi:hypothetical protein